MKILFVSIPRVIFVIRKTGKMGKKIKISDIVVNKIQFLIGIVCLITGTLVYLVDRPPGSAYFLSQLNIDTHLIHNPQGFFGVIGNSLPAFAHVLSFILLTASLMHFNRINYLVICILWLVIDGAFELGQKFDTFASGLVPEWFNGIPVLETTKNYFIYGTFDVFDMAGFFIGAIIGYILLMVTGKQGRQEQK